MRRRWKTLGRLFVVAFTCIAFAIGAWFVWATFAAERREAAWRAKGYPTTLTELDEWYARPPDGENAADYYMEAGKLIAASGFPEFNKVAVVGGDDSSRLGYMGEEVSEEELRRTAAFLLYHERAYELMADATQFNGARYPVDYTRPTAVNFEHFSYLRHVWRALILKTYYHCAAGEPSMAVEAFGQLAHAVNSLDEEPAMLSGSTRSTLLGGAVSVTEYLLDTVDLSGKELEELDEALESLVDNDHLLRMAVGERCWTEGAFVHAPGLSRVFGAFTRTRYLAALDNVIVLLERPFYESVAEFEALESSVLDLVDLHDIGLLDRWMRHLPYKSDGYLEFFVWEYQRENARVAAARAAVRVELVRADGQRLPDDMSGLPKQYVEDWPTDPFTNEPIRYRKLASGYITYSVGRDLRDDRGGIDDNAPVDAHHERDHPDIVFRVFR